MSGEGDEEPTASSQSRSQTINIKSSDSSTVSENTVICEQNIHRREPLINLELTVNNNNTVITPAPETQTGKQQSSQPPKRSADNERAGPSKRPKGAPSDKAVELLVVEKLERRQKKKRKPFWRMAVLAEGDRKVRDLLIFQSQLASKLGMLEVKKFVKLTDVKAKGERLKCTENTKILEENQGFRYDHGLVEKYINPRVISVSDALYTPRGRIISVEGKIKEVVENFKSKPRKNITLVDMQNGEEIAVTLWEKSAEETELQPMDIVTITALLKKAKGLSSTSSTAVKKRN